MRPDTEITKEFDFDAAHWLPHVPAGHKCGRLHGHTYRVVIICSGIVGPQSGWFMDYADIAKAWAPLHERLDHHVLNQVHGLTCPTTEVLCAWILAKIDIPHLNSVRVYESSTTWCEVHVGAAYGTLLLDAERSVSEQNPRFPYDT